MLKTKAKTARNIGPLTNEYEEVVDSPQEICEEFTEEIVMKKSD